MALGGLLQAQETPSLDSPLHLPALAWEDTKAVVQAPMTWDGSDWTLVALGTASVGLAVALDRRADDWVLRHRRDGWDRVSQKVETLRGVGRLALVGGIYVGGVLSENSELRALGADAGMAVLVSGVAFDLPLKAIAGRARPMDERGPHHFHSFGPFDSFPSGHATQAFAIASVSAGHTDNPWISTGAYGMATLVGLARMEQRQHYLSDVVAGALLGMAVGKIVVRTNQRLRQQPRGTLQVSLIPAVGPDFRGLSLRAQF